MLSLYSIFQIGLPSELIISIVALIIFITSEIVFLKIGLKITKAEKRINLKWIVGSIFIQIGLIVFIGVPLIIIGASGGFEDGGPNLAILISLLIIGILLEINLINVLHEPGFGKSIVIFIFFVIPIVLTISVLVVILT
ncbi:MAG: hypothetical protein EU518_01085 [Promethearchaeota archaeon]|nr:MAG: hypothetical protein EU518_01085 [Candidatus Lokiarchaeota archaeon]